MGFRPDTNLKIKRSYKMLRSIKHLRGYQIHAKDGEIGKSHEFYFDDDEWTIRYLIVDTGNWLPGRLVLISPHALGQPGWEEKIFPVELTKKQVENSPGIDRHKSVSRQKEFELGDYYGWPAYWGGVAAAMPGTVPETASTLTQVKAKENIHQEHGDLHLRSTREVIGYKVQAKDDIIGRVKDFIVEDETWKIRYMVVVMRKWLHWLPGGKKVLVAPPWIEQVDWSEYTVNIDIDKEVIKKAPKYKPSKYISRDYEIQLFKYYSKPEYWLEDEK
jgi:hypothetical protein